MMTTQSFKIHVFTTTDNRFRCRQLSQLVTQCKRTIQKVCKLTLLPAKRKQLARGFMLSGRCQSRDLTFQKRQLKTTNTSRLSSAVNIWNRRLLKLIHSHAATINHASQQLRQLDIRQEMKTTREIITRNAPALPTANQRHAFELLFAVRLRRPASTSIRHSLQLSLQIKRLRSFTEQADREPCQLH